jgi:hypothetical protein
VTFKELAQELCRREGKNVGVNIAQVSELLDCLMSLEWKLDNVKPKGVSTAKPNIPTVPPPEEME